MTNDNAPEAGTLIREWRQRRHLSQLDLALDADISQRHLSFVETGRSLPSREMVLRLTDRLSVPLRNRNQILVAAGFAPAFPERPLDSPDMAMARETIAAILDAHTPHPALAVDRYWNLLMANRAVDVFLVDLPPDLLAPPINVLRLSLHPDGLARRIVNLAEWRAHALARLGHEVAVTADPRLAALREELVALDPHPGVHHRTRGQRIAVPLILGHGDLELSFFTTTTVFGTAVEVSLSEVTIETFFPADTRTARHMQGLMET